MLGRALRRARGETLKLDLGCGKNKHEGYIGVDKEKFILTQQGIVSVDIVHNLNDFPWPFSDNSVSEVLCHNVLEHLESPWKAVKEIIRICKSGARIHVRFPVPEHPNAWKDPDHKYTFAPRWFNQFGEIRIIENTMHYAVPRFGRLGKLAKVAGIHRFGPDEHRLTFEVVKQ